MVFYQIKHGELMRILLTLLATCELLFAQSQAIQLLSPNGSENVGIGTTHRILWNSTGMDTSLVRIRGTVDNGGKWFDIVRQTANTGSYAWQVPDKPSTLWKVKVWNFTKPGIADESDGIFQVGVIPEPPPGPGPDTLQKRVTLTWNRNQEPDIAGYKVYFGPASRAYDSVVAVNDTSYTKWFGVGTHYFAVTAYDLAGNESNYSDEVFATIAAPPQDKTPPGRPSGVGIRVE